MRGGAGASAYFEWGGKNADGSEGFAANRNFDDFGEVPIHQLMVANGVSAYFHGHDHQYVYEKTDDGIVYQEVPSPGSGTSGFSGIYSMGDHGSYETIQMLSNSGHLLVTVNPSDATVDYISSSSTSGTSNYAYTIEPAGPSFNLTTSVNPAGSGTIDPSEGVRAYNDGSVVNVTAAPSAGFVFDHWGGNCSGSDTCQVTMDADKSVTAYFVAAPTSNLTTAVIPGGAGSTSPAVGTTPYTQGAVVPVTASASPGYTFSNWSGDCSGTGSCSVTMDGDKNVVANFAASAAGLVTRDGSSSFGSVASATALSFAHTITAGTDKLVMAGISWNTGTDTTPASISSVVFNYGSGSSIPLTQAYLKEGQTTTASNKRYSAIWYAFANFPADQAGTIVVTFNESVSNGIGAGAANFSGADPVNTFGTPNGATNTSSSAPSVTLTGLNGNELVFDNVFMGGSSSSQTLTAGADQTRLWQTTYVANLVAGASIEQAAGSSVTMSWTAASSAVWVIAAIPINPGEDTTSPTVTIDQASAQSDPTNAAPINFTVVFSEPVDDFATGDVTLSGGAGATTAAVTGSGTTYNVAVSGMTVTGTVIATLAAGVAHDSADNPNIASTSSDNQVTYQVDTTPPTVTINKASAQPDPTSASPINFTVVFSETVTDFATGDVTLSGSAGAATAAVTGSGTTYNVAVSGMATSGTVIAALASGVAHDGAGNPSAASTSTDNSVDFTHVASVTRDGSSSFGSVASATSLSFAHTITAGTDKLVMAGISWNTGTDTTPASISSVVFNYGSGSSIPLTQAYLREGQTTTASNKRYSAIWYAFANFPENQAGTIVVTFNESVSNGIGAGAANFSGADPVNTFGTPNGATNTSSSAPSVTLTGLNGNELVFDNVFMGGSSSSQTLTAGADQTRLWQTTYVANLVAGASIEQAAGSSVTMSWTAASSAVWVIAAIPINPDSGLPPTCYALTLGHTGQGSDPAATPAKSAACPGNGQYVAGAAISLSGAVPSAGWQISGWTGTNNNSSTAATNTVTMPASAHSAGVTYSSLPVTFSGAELLGRPTDTSITISVIPDVDVSLKYQYATTSGGPYTDDDTFAATGSQPNVKVIDGLTPNTKYYYRLLYSTDGGSNWTARPEHTFYTQRAAGSTFSFTITSDSHINIALGNQTTWTNTLNDIKADNADFEIDLGDTVAMDNGSTSVAVGDTAAAEQKYKDTLPYFNIISASSPLYMVAGNHEQQEAWHLLNPLAGSLPVMGKNAEKKFFLNPIPNSFYSGDEATHPNLSGDQLLQDYYSWTWGDALFVVISPFWYTTTKPYTTTVGGGETDTTGSGDRWDWTLGQNQFNWLKTTLENSPAKYKFIFAHQIVGGNSLSSPDQVNYGHGGVDSAKLVEWGGYNVGGSVWGWNTQRPEWGSQPIHQLMVANGVSAFFHGHDHQYAYEKLDGIVYQAVPSAGFSNGFGMYTTGGNDGKTIQAISSPGHLKVTVGPVQTSVDYFQSSASTSAYTYTILPPAENHNPVIAGSDPRAVSMSEDSSPTPFSLSLSASDEDPGDVLTWGVASPALNGSITISGTGASPTVFTYLPNPNFFGSDSFIVRVSDQAGAFDTVQVNVTVTAVNDPPVITNQTALTTPQETPLAITLANLTVIDPDNIYPADFSLQVLSGSNYTFSGTTITPAALFFGTLTVPVRVNDGSADSTTYNLSVGVTPIYYTLTITKASVNSGTGTVTSFPDGINCGGTCAALVQKGRTVTLTATGTDAYNRLASWSGGGCTGTGTCDVTVNSDTTVTATFEHSTFNDVPFDHPLHDYIEILFDQGYTSGCQAEGQPLMFCPAVTMIRAESAVFMLRALSGVGYIPPTVFDTFGDTVWTVEPLDPDIQWARKWAEGMFDAGMTAGCQYPADTLPKLFCPYDLFTREQGAVFGLRIKNGKDYTPPEATGTVFDDLTDTSYWATKWMEKAYADGLLLRCDTDGGTPSICPTEKLDRSEAAYMIVKAKNLE